MGSRNATRILGNGCLFNDSWRILFDIERVYSVAVRFDLLAPPSLLWAISRFGFQIEWPTHKSKQKRCAVWAHSISYSREKVCTLKVFYSNEIFFENIIEWMKHLCSWFIETADVYSPYVLIQLISSVVFLASSIFQMDLVNIYYSSFSIFFFHLIQNGIKNFYGTNLNK